jgi:organic hydroperoxide reductase OsmC/OhrA
VSSPAPFPHRYEVHLRGSAEGAVLLRQPAARPPGRTSSELVQSAERHCLVSRALRTPVEVRLEVQAVP